MIEKLNTYYSTTHQIKDIRNKINEIIDYLNKDE